MYLGGTQYCAMAGTQAQSPARQLVWLPPLNQVSSGAGTKVKSPSADTLTQPNRYMLNQHYVNNIVMLLQKTYSLFFVTEDATIFFSSVLIPFVILMSQPLSRK